MTHLTSKFPKRGFTLVEMLVVITIIAALVAISFVGLSSMRSAADKVTSSRNLSQYQLANTNYATDNNGKFVPLFSFDGNKAMTSSWYSNPKFLSNLKGEGAVYNGTKTDYSMPLGMLDPVTVKAKRRLYDKVDANYAYNETGMPGGSWGNPDAAPGFTMNQLVAPERSAAFATSTNWIFRYADRFNWKGAAAVEGKTSDGKLAFRHKGKALVVYYDGHVAEIGPDDLKRIDQQGGVKNPFWDAGATTEVP